MTPAAPDPAALRGLPTAADFAFLRKLDPRAKRATKVSGGSAQVENATRQRCRRRGWVLFRDTGEGFGWILTKDGRALLARAEATSAAQRARGAEAGRGGDSG